MTTLEIRPLWFSPKCMCTRTLCSQSYEHLENKITLLGPDGGLISEVPLYYGFPSTITTPVSTLTGIPLSLHTRV